MGRCLNSIESESKIMIYFHYLKNSSVHLKNIYNFKNKSQERQ